MKRLATIVWTISVLVGLTSAFSVAEDAPKLPERYAVVVLKVEGMT